jgi:hypothetical protein
MKSEARNPFYVLLLLFSVIFAVTALAYAVVPWDAQPAWLQARGWQLILLELAAIILFGLASLGLDRVRSRKESGIGNQDSGIRD